MKSVALLALVVPFLSPQEQEEVDLSWAPSEPEVYEFEVFESSKRTPASAVSVFSRDIKDGMNPMETPDIALSLGLSLPQKKVKLKQSWSYSGTFFKSLPPLSETKVIGTFTYSRATQFQKKKCAQIDGAFQLWFGASKKPEAQIETSQWYSLEDSKIIGIRYRYTGKAETWGEFGEVLQNSKKLSFDLEFARSHSLKGAAPLERVDAAVKLGREYLLSRQARNGGFGETGLSALVLAALLHSGARRTDSEIQKAFLWLHSQKIVETYDAACALIAIEAAYLPLTDYEDILEFDEKKARAQISASISKADLEFARALAKLLIDNQAKSGAWTYSGTGASGDQSNTQFAALGLKTAARLGIAVPRQTWKRLAEYLMSIQRPSEGEIDLHLTDLWDKNREEKEIAPGGWTYNPPDAGNKLGAVTSTMTCGCTAALAMCLGELAEDDAALAKSIRACLDRGLAWIQAHYSVRKVPIGAQHRYLYYLYALERASILNGVKSFDQRDWYTDGAFSLFRLQNKDGSWDTGLGSLIDTAFALLFLKRAVVPVVTKSGE